MKIAILLGQSEYQNIGRLPACKNDLAVMSKLIKATDSFDQILLIDDKYNIANNAKEEIINFVELYKNNEIDELFLYFTGHGYFDGNEFFYLWGDFDQIKKRQTSLQNSEIDELLNQFNPKLYVKVIDACNSGVLCIKDTGSIENYFNDTRDSFNKFYFFFSSSSDQYSLADSTNSFFSSSFIQSIDRNEGKKIRYKDIIDFISDSFERIGQQTPLFITKAEFTEVFCSVNKSIKKIIDNFYTNFKKYNINAKEVTTLADIVKFDAEKYVDFETAKRCLMYGFESVKSFKIDKELESCYEKEVKLHLSYDAVPKMNTIANWIAKSDNDLFVNIVYENQLHDVQLPINIIASSQLYNFLTNNFDHKKAEKDVKIPKFFENKFSIPYVAIFLTLKSKFSNILNYSFVLVPLLSRTRIYYFYSKLNYNRIDWDDQEIDQSSTNWELETFDFDYYVIKTKINRLIQDKFISVVIDELTSRFNHETVDAPGNKYDIGQAEGFHRPAFP